MKTPVELEVRCDDFLKDNHHFYALKAKRKKIALIDVEVINQSPSAMRLLLDTSKLSVGDQTYNLERPETILWKLSEFTWDFLVYLIFCFHPVEALVDVFLFLFGPVYNRRLKKQLHSLSDGELLLKPGERKQIVLGFRGVSKGARQLQLAYCFGAETQQLQCDVA